MEVCLSGFFIFSSWLADLRYARKGGSAWNLPILARTEPVVRIFRFYPTDFLRFTGQMTVLENLPKGVASSPCPLLGLNVNLIALGYAGPKTQLKGLHKNLACS
jgi:hypothetical protein